MMAMDESSLPHSQEETTYVISGGLETCSASHSATPENTRRTGSSSAKIKQESSQTTEISFTAEERERVLLPHHDALTVTLLVANCMVKRILVDSGSSSNIIFQAAYQSLGLEEGTLIRKATPLIGFSREVKQATREIFLPIYAEGVSLLTRLHVVDCHSSYNMILGRAWIHGMRVVPSTLHQETTRHCYQIALKERTKTTLPPQVKSQAPHTEEPEVEDMDDVPLVEGDLTRNLKIGSKLSEGLRRRLEDFLRSNSDCFAWSHLDMCWGQKWLRRS
ncbi:uncharacterized protein LOC117133602 [Brassica rapa]|uniref:uncharacterized protein LOC117133602 n=1 Tax=Brassica campestris TaxID=3711 RepID=UPI00142DB0B4|nr:uncharacterized protein LOC117133602 [Brassica rapa]